MNRFQKAGSVWLRDSIIDPRVTNHRLEMAVFIAKKCYPVQGNHGFGSTQRLSVINFLCPRKIRFCNAMGAGEGQMSYDVEPHHGKGRLEGTNTQKRMDSRQKSDYHFRQERLLKSRRPKAPLIPKKSEPRPQSHTCLRNDLEELFMTHGLRGS